MYQVRRKELTESLEPEFDRLLDISDEQLCLAIEQFDDGMIALALMGACNKVTERLKSV